jgi:hypothetical protein
VTIQIKLHLFYELMNLNKVLRLLMKLLLKNYYQIMMNNTIFSVYLIIVFNLFEMKFYSMIQNLMIKFKAELLYKL